MNKRNKPWLKKATITFARIKCARCGDSFDTVKTDRMPVCCIECYQCCVPVDCAECGKTFGAVDPAKHRHTQTSNLVCTDCVYSRNMQKL